MPHTTRPRRYVVAVVATAIASLVTAGCGGSALSPEDVLRANLAVQGQLGAGGAGAGTGSSSLGGAAGQGGGAGPGSGGTAGAASGTTGGAGTTRGPGGTGGTGGSGVPSVAAGAGTKVGSCAGFKDGPGITDSTITIGNSADISGPVPGLFTAPQQATKAYVAYFNATNPKGICGRKLALDTYDSRTDAGGDQQATVSMCQKDFAGVGSLSAFDAGGAATAQSCGLPDLRANITTAARNECSTCFGADATGAHEYANAIPDFFVKKYRAASQKAAYLYLNAGAAAENAQTQIAVESRRGMKFVYTSGIDVTDFNYGAYVQQMVSKGVQWVQFLGGYPQAVRLAQAMQQANFKPQIRLFDQTTDDQGYLQSGGSAIEGNVTAITYTPLFSSQSELKLYKAWLQQVAPGAAPNAFGMFAWSAAKLFVEQTLALGGKLSRDSLVASLRNVHNWTGGGLHGPMDVGGKHAANCVRFQVVQNGRFVPFGPSSYMCDGITKAG